jgi:glycine oxidase
VCGPPAGASINGMAQASEQVDVVVVGGGIVGLSIAWAARARGLAVTVLERDRFGGGASHVAAGMLAPVSEAEYGTGGRRLLELGLRSAASWPRFAQALERASGRPLRLRRSGTLLLARDGDEAQELERMLELRRSLGLAVQRVRASAARELEPALAPAVRLALEVRDDHAVDPRAACAALRVACERAGVTLREHEPVVRVVLGAGDSRAEGVELADGSIVAARTVALAAGAWVRALAGIPERELPPVRPVKGQTLRLRDPDGAGLLERTLRFGGSYLVPRGDGRYVLGATVEERGFDTAPTAGATYELLRDAHELVPGVAELEVEELCVGLRPGTPDNAPVLGRCGVRGLVWAAGHHRNGVLLAPLTAELIAGVLAPAAEAGTGSVPWGETVSAREREQLLETCAPGRFAAGAHDAPAATVTVGAPR